MNRQPNASTTRRARRRPARAGLGTVLALAAVVLLALLAGAYWGEPISARLGLRHADGTSAGTPAGRQLWTCSMHPQVIQEKPGLCPICHMELTPLRADAGAPGGPGAPGAERTIAYWWDPMMNPPYISDKPGKSPMGMDLVPVYEEQVSGGAAVVLDAAVVQNIGVRVTTVAQGPLMRSVRAVGYLEQAQPNIRDINLRVSGWIERLYADTEGMHLKSGDPLFDLYSPDLQLAIEELIAARKAVPSATGEPPAVPDRSAEALLRASRTKLALWGLAEHQIEALAALEHAPRAITFVSPVEGDLTDKPIVEGAAVEAGTSVLRIVDHSTLWIDAQVPEQDLAYVHPGQKARAIVPSRPGTDLEGTVIFVDPRVDPATRTTRVRLFVANQDLSLRPGMYATVLIDSQLAEHATLVPREAVIDTGDRQIAFIATGVGHFEPRQVRTGLSAQEGMVQVLQGLAPGEVVVVSGQFLLDSESRLREAVRKYLGAPAAPLSGAGPDSGDAAAAVVPKGPALRGGKELVQAYLHVAETLGKPETPGLLLDLAPLLEAADNLRSAAAGGPHEAHAAAIAGAAQAMAGQPLDQQRERFKTLSEAVIALAEASAISAEVADRLFVAHCPMAPGSWLQRGEEIANPFYATDMKRCGEILRTIQTAPRVGGDPQ